jgi:hypothetical protein
LINSYIGYNNQLSTWQDITVSLCPNDTWANGFNIFINCDGLGIISVNLYCSDIVGNVLSSVSYSNSPNFNTLSQWQIPNYCSGKYFLKGFIIFTFI